MRSPVAVAYLMVPTTSETERHATTSRGRISRQAGLTGRRISSKPGEPGLNNSPSSESSELPNSARLGTCPKLAGGVTPGLERIEHGQTSSGGLPRVARKGS